MYNLQVRGQQLRDSLYTLDVVSAAVYQLAEIPVREYDILDAPTPDVTVVDLTVEVEKETIITMAEIHDTGMEFAVVPCWEAVRGPFERGGQAQLLETEGPLNQVLQNVTQRLGC